MCAHLLRRQQHGAWIVLTEEQVLRSLHRDELAPLVPLLRGEPGRTAPSVGGTVDVSGGERVAQRPSSDPFVCLRLDPGTGCAHHPANWVWIMAQMRRPINQRSDLLAS